MLNVKIDPAEKAELEAAARRLGITLSEFVRREIRSALARLREQQSPRNWDLLKAYSGRYESSDPELSTRRVARAAIPRE